VVNPTEPIEPTPCADTARANRVCQSWRNQCEYSTSYQGR